jgi:hypothetical protein
MLNGAIESLLGVPAQPAAATPPFPTQPAAAVTEAVTAQRLLEEAVAVQGDIVAPSTSSAAASWYAPFGARGGAIPSSIAADLGDRYGPQVGYARASPSTTQLPPSAQRAALPGGPIGGEWADLPLGLLARYVARHGAGPFAQVVQFAGGVLLAAIALAPQTPSVDRRQPPAREQRQRRPRGRPKDEIAASDDGERSPHERRYLDDIVQRAGETIAIHRQDIRSFLWPF